MACDFTIASDLARFGQAGPKHGSAPDGGTTDFLPLFVGMERAMASGALCEQWTAYQAKEYGLVHEVVPVLRVNGELLPNPLVVTDRYVDNGRVVFGHPRTGAEKDQAKAVLKAGTVDLTPLDEAVEALATELMLTFPGCTRKTIESLRKHKVEHWDRNKESNRAWLALNMMNEARLGFRAFNEGPRGNREISFVALRQRLAAGEAWNEAFIDSQIPGR